MSLLEETIWRVKIRQILTSCHIGRLAAIPRAPWSYDRRRDYATKCTGGVEWQGKRLRRSYKVAAKQVQKFLTAHERARRYFTVNYNSMDGTLELTYISSESQKDEREF